MTILGYFEDLCDAAHLLTFEVEMGEVGNG